jgi:NAD(P)-dependent dehydrogenase (short-subunit alcohol dehydrogenase family)
MKSFGGRSVVITGGSGGIGTALVCEFLARGARVFATGKHEEKLDRLKEIAGADARLSTAAFDVSDEASCRAFADRVAEEWKEVHVLVNNAGWYPTRDFEELSYEEWRRVLAVNLDGQFLMTRSLLPLMKESGTGRIVNTGSGSIFAGTPNQCHYVTAKAGVIGFTRALANVVGKYGITVNAVLPGLTITPPVEKLFPEDALAKQAQERAIKRNEMPNDLVSAVCFFASEEAAFVTGQSLLVDGGNRFH